MRFSYPPECGIDPNIGSNRKVGGLNKYTTGITVNANIY